MHVEPHLVALRCAVTVSCSVRGELKQSCESVHAGNLKCCDNRQAAPNGRVLNLGQ